MVLLLDLPDVRPERPELKVQECFMSSVGVAIFSWRGIITNPILHFKRLPEEPHMSCKVPTHTHQSSASASLVKTWKKLPYFHD